MIKVVMVGAGSVVFSKNLTGDILGFAEFKNAAFSYMDIDEERLEVGALLCKKVAAAVGANPKIEATTDRRAALSGADFVINMVQIGGFNATLVDFEIPRKYGLNFTIADTTGPGGFFRALRTFPMLKGLCADMMAVCPKATLLNYSNPMSMNMQTITRTSDVRAVGLCHSVQGTLDQLMGYLDIKPSDVAFTCAGINHMAFYTRLEKDGVDLYPALFKAMSDKKIYGTNKVRFELMKRLGYFVTESSEHNAEYSPYFIPHGREHFSEFDVPVDEYLRRCDNTVAEFERLKKFCRTDEPMVVHRSPEYGSTIIHSMVTGTPSVVYGNMPNRGAISNLPPDAIAEAPTLVDRAGLRFTTVGSLPPQLIAYMNPHVQQHELFIRAALEGRRDHVYQAALFDPLTAATMTTDKIVEMCDELIAAHGFEKDGGSLPNLDTKKTLVPASGKTFGHVESADLRKSWDDAQKAADADTIAEWLCLGPFASGTAGAVSLDMATPFETDFTRTGNCSIDFAKKYDSAGKSVVWAKATAKRRGFVNCDDVFGHHEYSVAYGYAEISSISARDCVLRLGSDDGVKLWLNGKLVHTNDTKRGYKPDSDHVPVRLQAGVNRLIVKLSQQDGRWGWGVTVPKE